MDIGTFSHPSEDTPLSSPLMRLEPMACQLTRFLGVSSAAMPAKRRLSLDFNNLDPRRGCLADVALTELGGMIF